MTQRPEPSHAHCRRDIKDPETGPGPFDRSAGQVPPDESKISGGVSTLKWHIVLELGYAISCKCSRATRSGDLPFWLRPSSAGQLMNDTIASTKQLRQQNSEGTNESKACV
jgi:hypothetical protein